MTKYMSASLESALEDFVDVMANGGLGRDLGPRLNCGEADVFVVLLEALDEPQAAKLLLTSHYYPAEDGNENEDDRLYHHDADGERDPRIVPSLLFGDGPTPY